MITIMSVLAHPGVVAHVHPHGGVDIDRVAFAFLMLAGLTVVAAMVLRHADDVPRVRD